jgi:2-polyprenyl-3-methyl-5-hydroxy-6-metoxy-1,4-benzoquinol methylase
LPARACGFKSRSGHERRSDTPQEGQVGHTQARYHPGVDATAPRLARGHFLQPEWTGEHSIRQRFDAVKELLEVESILDIGCASRHRRDDWIHGLIAGQCADLVGIDLDEDAIASITQRGHDVRVGDARNFDLGRKFEVVFAGELIEHLDDVRGFLRSARRHLLPGGKLVLTTPNAFYYANFVYRFGGHAHVHPEHTCWFCEDTIRRILTINGFRDVKVSFMGHTSPSTVRRAFVSVLRKVLPPRLALDTIVVVASPAT